MATETIKIANGSLLVNRIAGKESFEVSLSDIDSVSFERGGEGEGQSDGTLVLFTKDGERFTVRVADDEVGKYLKGIYDGAKNDKPAAKAEATK